MWKLASGFHACRVPAQNEKSRLGTALFICEKKKIYALSTAPERKQEVHTYIFLFAPFSFTRTDFTLAFQIALVLLWEWLTLLPK